MSPETRSAIVADYVAGMKIREITAKHHCHGPQIYRALATAGISPCRYPPRQANRLEDAEWLADCDLSLGEVCERLGVTQQTFWTFCWRRNRLDLYIRLADREPDAEVRRAIRRAKQRRAA